MLLDILCIFVFTSIDIAIGDRNEQEKAKKDIEKTWSPSRNRILWERARPNLTGARGEETSRSRVWEVQCRECHLWYVLNRLKCILKGNRERSCNFPRETEHEIKRGCRIVAHSLTSRPSLFRALTRVVPLLHHSRCFLIRPGLFFPLVALHAPRRGF